MTSSALRRMEAEHGVVPPPQRRELLVRVHGCPGRRRVLRHVAARRGRRRADHRHASRAPRELPAPSASTRPWKPAYLPPRRRQVEHEVADYATTSDERVLREGVLRYSREVAFAAAEVAGAAEARGVDAPEALVVDAVVRHEADDSMQSRATALGWGSVASVTVVAGSPAESPAVPPPSTPSVALRAGPARRPSPLCSAAGSSSSLVARRATPPPS